MCSATATADYAQILPGHYRLNAAGCYPPHAAKCEHGNSGGKDGQQREPQDRDAVCERRPREPKRMPDPGTSQPTLRQRITGTNASTNGQRLARRRGGNG